MEPRVEVGVTEGSRLLGLDVEGSSGRINQRTTPAQTSSNFSRISGNSETFASMVIRPTPEVRYVEDKLIPDPVRYMLLFMAVGIISYVRNWGPVPTFCFNAVGTIPLGVLQSRFTRAMIRSKVRGVFFFHAVLRNSVEFVLAIAALKMADYSALKAFLLGAIVCNQLVVGAVHIIVLSIVGDSSEEEESEPLLSDTSLVLIWLIATSVLVPSAVSFSTFNARNVVWLSRACACILLVLYECILFSEIPRMPSEDDESFLDSEPGQDIFDLDDEELGSLDINAGGDSTSLGPGTAALLLILTLSCICLCCTAVMSSLTGASMAIGVPPELVAFAVLPFLGNTTEFLNVGMNSAESRSSIGNALGSSILIGLLIFPAMMLLAWIFDIPMSYVVTLTEAVILLISSAITSQVFGSSSMAWIKGAALLTVFAFFSVGIMYESS